jgi:hypothetical protein
VQALVAMKKALVVMKAVAGGGDGGDDMANVGSCMNF